ncbi:hypothetical protein A2V49_04825 [candidate division WWE3 bacterium RBG_19FT_COMBO_34_6]|uniref:HNH nuclease domain-containing protein n=1 Tax=candidate division WWE3 bacterium RBG_19FT_COMBO_34_6 TaxID=1802612 RepID=A0A1F4UKN2_UNCKA|nr:MAG: hypothetical protein A2V49_04825 [candidate division WWE3 bacterium RBG_19FT_COMBO_34_6]
MSLGDFNKVKERYRDQKWLIQQYVNYKKGIIEIGRICSCTGETIRYWLNKHKIPIRHSHSGDELKMMSYRNKLWIKKEYIDNQRSTVDIASELGSSPQTINYWLKKFSIPLRDSHSIEQLKRMWEKSSLYETKYHLTKEYLIREYLSGRKTINQISSEYGCSWDVVYKRLIKYGLPIRQTNISARGNGVKRTTTDFKRFQKMILKVYGYKCAICGYNKFVISHHIIGRATSHDDSLKNGIALCPNHHAEADNGTLTVNELKQFQINES